MNSVGRLRCEYLPEPLGLDEPRPRLSWNLESDRPGARQTAWRVRVASAPEILARGDGDLWDSGRQEGAQTTQVEYAGRPLRSRERCHWAVEAWDEIGGKPLHSPPAFWSMGLLEASEWHARWIAAHPEIYRRDSAAAVSTPTVPGSPAYFRREFTLPKHPRCRHAVVYASARGIFDLEINGQRVSEDLFAPEWTDYDKRLQYRTYDVTALMRPGANTLTAVLGDGWWSGFVGWQETRGRYGLENSLLAQLEVELADGQRQIVATDSTWECNTGPLLSSDFMMGEVYDARRAPHAPYPWLSAREVAAPRVPLVAQRSPPVRMMHTFEPVSATQRAENRWTYDLGQNFAGFVRLRLPALPAGTRITLRHAERLTPEGELYTDNLRRAKSTDVYITSGQPTDWSPRFTFHGFQYVEVERVVPDALSDADRESTSKRMGTLRPTLQGLAIHSSFDASGHFECSDPRINRLWLNIVWSQRGNSVCIPTDCPQRDERLGWTGDAQVFLRTATYHFDVAAFMSKWMTDVEDAQTPEGIFPDTAPRLREGPDAHFVGLDGLGGAAGWADAGIIVPHTLWRVYGDLRLLARHWRAMVAWMDYLESTNPRSLRENELGNNYGDWLCLPSDTRFRVGSPMKTFLATAYWADDAAKMARMARALNLPDDEARFAGTAQRVRAAFQREFLADPSAGRLSVETQTAYVLALAMNLLPEGARAGATARLLELIAAEGGHLSTGFIGISHLNPTLTLTGNARTAYALLLRDDFPSWLYPVRHGATTIWERWNGWTEKEGFFDPSMNSFNHYSLGSIGEWLFRHLAGIELDEDEPGFSRFVLRPYLPPRDAAPTLTSARATFRSPHGEILSEWERKGASFRWTFRVPPNTTALVDGRVFEPGTHRLEGALP